MDNFAEYLVKKRPDSHDNLKKILLITATILVCAITIFFTILMRIPFILIITFAVIYGAYYLISGLSVEYEYAVTNDEMDIDKIIARRKRSHLITVDIRKFEAFGVLDETVPKNDDCTLVLCSDNTGEGEYYADLTMDDYGFTRIVFTPNDAIVEAITASLSPQLRMKLRKE